MKKCISLTLTLLLVLTAAIPAFGAQQQSTALEKAILKVKSVVNIPADYNKFDYSSYQSKGKDQAAVTVWELGWSKADGGGSMRASVDSLGNLNEYYQYTNEENSGLSKVSRDEGEKTAKAFLTKAMGSMAKDMRLLTQIDSAAASGNLNYAYRLYVKDIAVPFVQVEIYVNKHTGQVDRFFGMGPGFVLPAIQTEMKVKTKEQATTLYFEKLGPELNYYTSYDYDKDQLKVFAAYSMGKSAGKAMDAQTGQVVEIYSRDMGIYDRSDNSSAGESAKAGAAPSLSPEEQTAVNKVEGLLSQTEAEHRIREAARIAADRPVYGASLWQNYEDKEQYCWTLRFEDATGIVDAKTGEVLSFSLYGEPKNGNTARVSEAQAVQKAEALLKELCPEKLEQSKFQDTKTIEEEKQALSYTVSYRRQENGIGVYGDELLVTVDARTGEPSYYHCSWHNTAVFPAVENAIGQKLAFQKFCERGKLSLQYQLTGKDLVSPVYDFENSVTNYLLDAVSGTQLRMDGEKYRESGIPDYNDIKGHWAEKTIQKLCDNGYYIEGNSFQPEVSITQETFLRYLYTQGMQGMSQEDFYKSMERGKIVLKGEKAPEKLITRQEAAKYMVRYLGFDKIAQKSAIFADPFKDKTNSSYKGYAAVCYGLGIMKGDEKGRFNGTQVMTRAEAACGICQLLDME